MASSEDPTAAAQDITDWSKCILCQHDNKETLICPAKSTRTDTGAGYKTLAENLIRFHELQCMPLDIDISSLDNGSGIAATLNEQEAKWHKSCYLKVNKKALERKESHKRKSDDGEASTSKRIFTRLCTEETSRHDEKMVCFFCSIGTADDLHEFRTFQTDYRVRKCAYDLQDEQLIAKLSTGDLIAIEAKYHRKCLANLYNKARALQKHDDTESKETTCQGIALAELISYIQESRQYDDIKVFRLADLVKLYQDRLEQLCITGTSRINSTHLKNRILVHLPNMSAYKKGRDVFLAYECDVGTVLWEGYHTDFDEQSIMLKNVADIIRRDIFSKEVKFTGSFDHDSQVQSVPQSLLSLVSMLISGSNIKDQSSNVHLSQPVLTIAQLVVHNCVKRRRDCNKTPSSFHSKDRETPLPVYVGLKVHALTRQRQLIDCLFALGVCDSYDRIMDITSALGNHVCEYYQQIDVVCPPQLKPGLFLTSAADNIDHNPSSSTSTGSFHGTGLSLFQNIVSDTVFGEDDRGFTKDIGPITGQRKMTELPFSYTNVKPTSLRAGNVYVPDCHGELVPNSDNMVEHTESEYNWLCHVQRSHASDFPPEANISWAAYHASLLPEPDILPSINAMLPLFSDEACSPTMMRHCFEVVQAAVQHINPGQIPVISVDQPLFAKGKLLQWSTDTQYTEENIILLLGGLHTELTSYKVLGHWLEGSGWVEALLEAKLASSGVADSFLKASHISRTRHAHQVTACTLFILLKKAYNEYVSNNPEEDVQIGFDDWCTQRKTESPQFLFWFTCLELELLVFSFVRSLRTGNFDLYLSTITKLTPWFFSLNHTNYARWMPIHVRDMCSLDTSHPDVAREFRTGKFVMAKSQRKFSLIAIDHGHEQNNGTMKEDGGIIGLTQDSEALLRWAVAGPELVRVISEFESSIIGKTEESTSTNHHEQTKASQKRFATQVTNLVGVMEGLGNPFEEESADLIRLHSRDIMAQDAVECLTTIKFRGQEQYNMFLKERLKDRTKPITDPITRNKVVLFNEVSKKVKTKSQENVTLLKSESSLFARLYVACQTRHGDLDNFFSHENQPFPPSLSSYGQLRQGKKSDLMGCLERLTQSTAEVKPNTDVTVLDGAVLVNILRPEGCKTFADYASKVFVPYIKSQQSHTCRVDIVWDQYFDNSLKAHTRETRATGPSQRRRVELSSPVPKNWQQFLRVNENKVELFKLLNNELTTTATANTELILTDGPGIICIPVRDSGNLAPCNHEEADSRIMVHVADAVLRGFNKFLVRTVDTDVVVLAVAAVQELGLIEIWIAFGTGKDFRYVPVHEIAASLGPRKSLALPMFHAFTGCDTVSHFAQVGKTTAWKVWESCVEATNAFYEINNAPQQITEEVSTALEHFTILLYDRSGTSTSINETRKLLFTKKGRQMVNLPPSKAALQQHIRRAALQGGYYWGSVTERNRQLPSPSDWGWKNPDKWEPLWTDLPEASISCQELLHCRCRTLCTNCKCKRAQLKCTAYCTCGGDCENG